MQAPPDFDGVAFARSLVLSDGHPKIIGAVLPIERLDVFRPATVKRIVSMASIIIRFFRERATREIREVAQTMAVCERAGPDANEERSRRGEASEFLRKRRREPMPKRSHRLHFAPAASRPNREELVVQRGRAKWLDRRSRGHAD
jgi:hypothetical protein